MLSTVFYTICGHMTTECLKGLAVRSHYKQKPYDIRWNYIRTVSPPPTVLIFRILCCLARLVMRHHILERQGCVIYAKLGTLRKLSRRADNSRLIGKFSCLHHRRTLEPRTSRVLSSRKSFNNPVIIVSSMMCFMIHPAFAWLGMRKALMASGCFLKAKMCVGNARPSIPSIFAGKCTHHQIDEGRTLMTF